MPSGTTADGKGDLGASDTAFQDGMQGSTAPPHRIQQRVFSPAICYRHAQSIPGCLPWLPLLKGNSSPRKLSVAPLKTADHDRGQKNVGQTSPFPYRRSNKR